MMKQRRAMGVTLVEILVVVLMLSVVLVMTLPSQGAARRTARRMQNSTQQRGIHQALVTFAQSNKGNFPGLHANGRIIENSLEDTGNSGDGDYVQARFWILLESDFFTPDYAISPSETANVWEYDEGFGEHSAPVQWDEAVKHYSYAMLSIEGDAGEGYDAARGSEWGETLNTQAIVLSDRNSGVDAENGVMSIHTGQHGDWKGTVTWNDNHVGFEQSHYDFETRYGSGELNVDDNGWGIDNLFSVENVDDNNQEIDALMPVYDDNGIHGGE